MSNNRIAVEVYRVDTYDSGKRTGRIMCPNCKDTHIHELGTKDEPIEDFLTRRTSHCLHKPSIQYQLVQKDGKAAQK